MHLFIKVKQLKLEEGGPGLSLDAWPVAGSVGCPLENDGSEGADVDLAFGREGKKCLHLLPPEEETNPAAERMVEREGGGDFLESMAASGDGGEDACMLGDLSFVSLFLFVIRHE